MCLSSSVQLDISRVSESNHVLFCLLHKRLTKKKKTDLIRALKRERVAIYS